MMMAVCVQRSKDPRLSAYKVVKQVGKGSYGEVFLVRHLSKKQYVMKNINLGASNAKERLAAEQEAALLSKLHHPNIVSYKESFQDELAVLHIVMGYCEGGDLCTRLKMAKDQLFPETQVVEWFVQIALALQYLHDKNILHRDLKTQNIFLSKSNIIKVGDLGIARVLDGSCELAQTVIGTPYYMSPELFANQPYNHKSDIWALGCCVYEMATLKHAFSAKNINALMYKILQGKVPPLPSQFSEDLSNLVQLMMARDARQRPSVHDILRMSFIRRHIKMFLDRTSSKRRSGKKSSPSSSSVSLTDGNNHQTKSGGSDQTGHHSRERKRRSSSDVCVLEERSVSEGSRSSPTSSLPQVNPSGNTEHESESAKRSKSKKTSRPLPPDPARKKPAQSKNVRINNENSESPRCYRNSPKPPTGQSALSARERRRRNKQEGGGAVRSKLVLKSKASSESFEKKQDLIIDGERVVPVKQATPNDVPSDVLKGLIASDGPNDVTDGPNDVIDGPNDVIDGPNDVISPEQHSSSTGEQDTVTNNGRSGDSDEVEEFYSLLDTTLHLPEAQVVSQPSQIQPPKQAFTEHHSQSSTKCGVPLPSGRLGDRIRALREECVRGLGEKVLMEALQVLETADLEQPEKQLLVLLGNHGVEQYAAKLQQLKLCEDSLCML